MAFKLHGSTVDNVGPVQIKSIITGSVASVLMDSVKLVSGFNSLGTAGAFVFGHVMSHIDKNGVGLLTTGVAGSAVGSYAGAYTVASTNTTVEMVAAIVDASKYTVYSGTPDATIGTTTGSDLMGYHTDLADEDEIDENNGGTVNAEATAQYFIWGLDPNTSSRGLYSIYESSVFGL